jgi:sugar lactone lactonase YvrE
MCAMDPASGASRFYANNRYTTAIGVDAAGRVLVGASSLERINGDGSRQVLASGFNQIGGIAADPSGVIYVSDNVDHTVQSVSSDGVVMLLAGQAGKPGYADGIGANAQLNYPGAITLDAVGNLYVADATTIRRITPQGEVRTIAGVPGQSGVQPGPALASPIGRVSGLAWFSGALYATVQNAVIRIAPLN